MSKEFNCPSCSAPIEFQGGESIFQTCSSCNAPVIVPSELLYKKEQQLASENFASLTNDKPVDVDQVTNELTPGDGPPKDEDSIDLDAKIEKFEVYQEKLGTSAVETKKAVDEIIAPKTEVDFKVATPYANPFENQNTPTSTGVSEHSTTTEIPINPVMARVRNELQKGSKIEAIKIFKARFNTSLANAKAAVDALERGEEIEVSDYLN